MKRLMTVVILLAALGCHEKVDKECIETGSGGPCPFVLRPVCGCNGKTYYNFCDAEAHGITKYTTGECKSSR